jgi:hypothetical protein
MPNEFVVNTEIMYLMLAVRFRPARSATFSQPPKKGGKGGKAGAAAFSTFTAFFRLTSEKSQSAPRCCPRHRAPHKKVH